MIEERPATATTDSGPASCVRWQRRSSRDGQTLTVPRRSATRSRASAPYGVEFYYNWRRSWAVRRSRGSRSSATTCLQPGRVGSVGRPRLGRGDAAILHLQRIAAGRRLRVPPAVAKARSTRAKTMLLRGSRLTTARGSCAWPTNATLNSTTL